MRGRRSLLLGTKNMQGRGTCRRAAGENPQDYQGSLATILIVGKDGDNGNEGEQGCPENSGH